MKQYMRDPWIQRTIVGALSVTLCTCAGGAVTLGLSNQPVHGLIIALGTGSLGALAQLLRGVN